MSAASTSAILDQIFDPVAECLTPDVATAIANLRVGPEVQARIDAMAEKCTEGELSDDEQAQYRAIVEAIDLISILQAKARARLRRS